MEPNAISGAKEKSISIILGFIYYVFNIWRLYTT